MCESQVTFNANFFEANKVAFKPAGRQMHDNQPSQTNQPTQSTRKHRLHNRVSIISSFNNQSNNRYRIKKKFKSKNSQRKHSAHR